MKSVFNVYNEKGEISLSSNFNFLKLSKSGHLSYVTSRKVDAGVPVYKLTQHIYKFTIKSKNIPIVFIHFDMTSNEFLQNVNDNIRALVLFDARTSGDNVNLYFFSNHDYRINNFLSKIKLFAFDFYDSLQDLEKKVGINVYRQDGSLAYSTNKIILDLHSVQTIPVIKSTSVTTSMYLGKTSYYGYDSINNWIADKNQKYEHRTYSIKTVDSSKKFAVYANYTRVIGRYSYHREFGGQYQVLENYYGINGGCVAIAPSGDNELSAYSIFPYDGQTEYDSNYNGGYVIPRDSDNLLSKPPTLFLIDIDEYPFPYN